METRYYNPQLLSGVAAQYAQKYHPDKVRVYGNAEDSVSIQIYPKGEKRGAYIVRKGRLYWDEDPSDRSYTNTDDDLSDQDIAECQVIVGHTTVFVARNFEKLVDELLTALDDSIQPLKK